MLSPRAVATHQAILDAARRCFAARGVAATTMREIAGHAGVTQPLIHHYFGSKEALFDAVLETSLVDYEKAQARQWCLPMGDVRFLTRGLAVLFRWLGAHPEEMRLATWARLEGKTGHRPQTLMIYQRVWERLEHAQRAGVIRANVDIHVAMLMIETLFKGYWDRRGLFEEYPLDAVGLDDRYLEQAIRTLLAGLLTPKAAHEALVLLEA